MFKYFAGSPSTEQNTEQKRYYEHTVSIIVIKLRIRIKDNLSDGIHNFEYKTARYFGLYKRTYFLRVTKVLC